MVRWDVVLLRIINSRRGRAYTHQIYADLERGLFVTLSEAHLRETVYGGRPAYQHEVRSFLSNLSKTGDLRRVSRGEYVLTVI